MKQMFYTLFGILLTFFVSACQEDEYIDQPYGGLSGEGICFGISKGNISWSPDSRTLLKADTLVLPCESMDERFGVSVITREQENSLQSRGVQITSKESLDGFRVSAFYYREGAQTAESYFEDRVTDGVNTENDTYYWPLKGTVDFLAITPMDIVSAMPTVNDYNQKTASFTFNVSQDVSKHKDIMVANALGLNNREAGSSVALIFKHLFASVRFLVGNMQFIKINSLSIENVYGGSVTFSYDKQNDTWTNSVPTTKISLTPDFVDTSGLPKGSEIAGNVNNATMFMIPQTLPDGAELRVSYTELLTGEEYNGVVDLSGQKWNAGKDYAYAFDIDKGLDVTIPTPQDQDAHYIMLEMPYKLGALSSYVSSIKATSRFLDDGSNTSTKSGISLKFKEDLSETQKLGFWTDERYVETIKVENGASTSSGVSKDSNIRGGSELSIATNKLSGSIVLFIEENNGWTNRNGKLELKATLKNGTEIVVGQGNFKQLCPSWNDAGIGVERIEDASTHPYGFDYNRTVVYTNPGNNWWILKELGCVLYSWGVNNIITDDEGGFITLERKTVWEISYINKVTLNYGELNALEGIASSADGLENTRSLYNFTGDSDFSTIESNLDDNLNWGKKEEANSEDVPEDYAAFVALSRNRMYEMKTIVTGNGKTETTYKPILYKNSTTNEDVIEWYLPSSEEAKYLYEKGTLEQGISPLDGTYWSSTAGDDANAYAHSYIYSNNEFRGIDENTPRMGGKGRFRVRAVRKKPN